MTRQDVLQSAEYWLARFQLELYLELKSHGLMDGIKNSKTRGAIDDCEYNGHMSSFFNLALSLGYVPYISFRPVGCVQEELFTISNS